MDVKYDAIIIGLGPVGSFMALKLEKYGLKVLAIDKEKDIPSPEGGGFTSFDPFFEEVEKINTLHKDAVCIYLTDGYAYLPIKKPELPVLWVITPGGQESEYFTFGEVIRLNESELESV